ncbi:NrtR DNA-binding winged helix domain-containing protein [Geodermatophilus sp. SYSU D00758]
MAKKDAKKEPKDGKGARKKSAAAAPPAPAGRPEKAGKARGGSGKAGDGPGRARAAGPAPARPLVAVDTAVLTVLPPDGAAPGVRFGELAVLQVRSAQGGWALPATLLAEGEPLARAAARALAEAGAPGDDVRPRQLPVLQGPDGVLTVPHLAWVPHERVAPVVAGSDGALRLAPVGEAGAARPEVVAAALERARREYAEAADPGGLLPDTFTLHELFVVHDAVAGHFDSTEDAFRLRIARHVEPTGGSARRLAGRPARLYRRRAPG